MFICKILLDVRVCPVGCKLIDLVLSKLDGNSDILSDNCLLNGEAWLSCENPRNDPWRCNMDIVACGLSMALVLTLGVVGFCCSCFIDVDISRINKMNCFNCLTSIVIHFKNEFVNYYDSN